MKRGKKKDIKLSSAPGVSDDTQVSLIKALEGGATITLSDGTPEPSDEGEQVTPEEGMILRGRIEKALLIPNRPDMFVVFAIRDNDPADPLPEGKPEGYRPLIRLSEVAAMRKLRLLHPGAEVELEWVSKVAMNVANYDKWLMRIEAYSAGDTKSLNFYQSLIQQYKILSSGLERAFTFPDNIDSSVPF